jgi:hypothetical protein
MGIYIWDGGSTGIRFTCRIYRRDIDDEWFLDSCVPAILVAYKVCID